MKLAFDLRDFKIPVDHLAPQEIFRTRQGDTLSYRYYPAWSEDLVILYHGVGGDSRYLCSLAAAIAQAGTAQVVTPDFRGHGASLQLSDKISPSQLEIDLEELLIHLKMKMSARRLILAGHSLGGGFALRVAVSDVGQQFSKFVAFAPYLPESFHAMREDFGGWILPNDDGSFAVNYPEAFKTGDEKTFYSAEFVQAAVVPEDLIAKLKSLGKPVEILTGAKDEVVLPERQRSLFENIVSKIFIVEDRNHITVVSKVEPAASLF
ncbi:MAG: alpha/beta hydrolase [Bdellovibrio sp.]|nr:alpha/beta hydrolase [Bdellovibrio sp.]